MISGNQKPIKAYRDTSLPHTCLSSAKPAIYNHENLILFANKKRIDIGLICFLRRSRDGYKRNSYQPESFDKNRHALVDHFLNFAFELRESVADSTAGSIISDALRFIDHIDANPDQFKTDFYTTLVSFLGSLELYSLQLATKQNSTTGSGKLSPLTIQRYVKAGFSLLQYIYQDYKVEFVSHTWAPNRLRSKPTTPLLEDELEPFLELMHSLFNVGYQLTVEKKELPIQLKVPAILNEPGNHMWLIPHTRKWICRNDKISLKDATAWDYRTGKLKTPTTYKEKRKYNAAKAQLENSNRYSNHFLRLEIANKALIAFAYLFSSVTGMNGGPLFDLRWFKKYDIIPQTKTRITVRSSQSNSDSEYFRGIKNRAKYSVVEFEITKTFLPLFKKYLTFREKLLTRYNLKCDYLFFSGFNRLLIKVGKLSSDENLRHFFKEYFPEIRHPSMRELRATKSDKILSKTNDVQTVAQILQNSPETVKKYYAMGTTEDHIKELGDFLGNVSKQILHKRDKSEILNSAGSCYEQIPIPIKNDNAIKTDCTTGEGCLFCENYRIHSDDIDVRKLFSMKYVINSTQYQSKNKTQFDRIFIPVIKRIDYFIAEIENIDSKTKKMVKKINDEVFLDGLLDPYWDTKLDSLEQLEY